MSAKSGHQREGLSPSVPLSCREDNIGRLDWIDAAKGIGIVLVVFGHAERGALAAGALRPGVGWSLLDGTIYTFHMPLFFLLAGLLARRSLKVGAARFLDQKLRTIAFPYVLWSLLQILLLFGAAGLTNSTVSPWDRLANLLWRPIAPFWFLYALFACHLLFVLLARWSDRSILAVAALLFIPGEILRGGVHDIAIGPDITRAFLFYALGNALAPRLMAGVALSVRASWAALVAAGGGLAVSAVSGFAFGLPYEANVPAALTGIAFTCLAATCLATKVSRGLRGLGRYSMAIFVMHIAVASGARIVLQRFLGVQDGAVLLAAAVALGLFVPLLVHRAALRAGVAALIGLPSERRSVAATAPAL